MTFQIPTLAEESARRAFRPQPKGASRLDVKTAHDKAADSALDLAKAACWTRDKHRCRCCGRKVIKSVALVPNRGDVHHIAVRAKAKALVEDVRNMVLLCAKDHQRVTGRVNDRLFIVQKAVDMFAVGTASFIDGSKVVTFEVMK